MAGKSLIDASLLQRYCYTGALRLVCFQKRIMKIRSTHPNMRNYLNFSGTLYPLSIKMSSFDLMLVPMLELLGC